MAICGLTKGCQSGRIAAAIKAKGKNVLYMYVGGGAVDHEQSYLLGGLVVICKNWRWAALASAAARVAGLASNNFLGSLSPALVIPFDDEASDAMTTELPPHRLFEQRCDSMWLRVCSSFGDLLLDVEKPRSIERSARSSQSEKVGRQLATLKSVHADAVKRLLRESI